MLTPLFPFFSRSWLWVLIEKKRQCPLSAAMVIVLGPQLNSIGWHYDNKKQGTAEHGKSYGLLQHE